MLSQMRTNVELVSMLFMRALRTELEYRGSFILKILGLFTNSVTFLVIWWIYFAQFESLNGWTIRETALMLAVSSAVIGWVLVFLRGLTLLARAISRGELDYYLCLPVNPLWMQAIAYMEMGGLGDLLFALFVLCFFVNLTISQLLLFIFLVFCGGIILASFLILTQSLAFYFGNFEDSAEQLWWSQAAFGLYPQSAYGGLLRVVSMTIFPSFFMIKLPVTIILNPSWHELGLMLGFTALFFSFSLWVFRSGLRRYESGNLINVLR